MALYGIRYTYDLHVKTAEGGEKAFDGMYDSFGIDAFAV